MDTHISIDVNALEGKVNEQLDQISQSWENRLHAILQQHEGNMFQTMEEIVQVQLVPLCSQMVEIQVNVQNDGDLVQ